jgi:hypothetical protein
MPSYRLNIDEDYAKMLDNAAKSEKIAPGARNKTQLLRRAVALYLFLHEQVDTAKQRRRVAIIDEDSKVVTVIDPLP